MYLCFHDPAFRVIPKNSSPNPRSPRFSPVLYTHLTWNACLFHSSSQPSSDCILEVSGLFSFVFIEFITILLLFYVSVFWPRGTWDPSSPTRNQAPTPATGRWSLNHWAIKEVPISILLMLEQKFRVRFQQFVDIFGAELGGSDPSYLIQSLCSFHCICVLLRSDLTPLN